MPEETLPSDIGKPELVKDWRKSESQPSSLTQPVQEAAVAVPSVAGRAPGEINSAPAQEKKQKRSQRESANGQSEKPNLPGKDKRRADSMLACAKIQVLAKRLECFDRLKRGTAEGSGNGGKG